ncbi:MAG: signal peptidase I [bacterium]|nr:signal peptidase I [bacterium]
MRKIINLERFIKNKTIREWTEALLFAAVVAFVFRTWLYAPYRVPTGSMIHTIEIGDHIFVNKHAYGYVVPLTDITLATSPVKRHDIIVFPYPEDPSTDFIKRAIAVGGDRVKLEGEKVYVNGELEEASFTYYDPDLIGLPMNREFVVPQGKIWVMGDNRRNSRDSRYWGFVDESTVAGKGVVIYWSHHSDKSLFEGYRLERIGKFLE